MSESSTATFIDLPARPTRDQLRRARLALLGLAHLGHVQASAELASIDGLIRELYPRRPEERTGPRRQLIDATDCAFPCDACGGSGKAGRQGTVAHSMPCASCAGEGKHYGTPEHKGRMGAFRGVYTPPEGPPRQPVHQARYRHPRGFACGRLWGTAPSPYQLVDWDRNWQHWAPTETGASSIDLDAENQGASAECLIPSASVTGRLGSRRDKRNLTEGQQRRSTMHGRTLERNRALNRQRLVDSGVFKRHGALRANRRALEALGIDVGAIERQLVEAPPVARRESATISEARRRGDLAPGDMSAIDRDQPDFARYWDKEERQYVDPHAGRLLPPNRWRFIGSLVIGAA